MGKLVSFKEVDLKIRAKRKSYYDDFNEPIIRFLKIPNGFGKLTFYRQAQQYFDLANNPYLKIYDYHEGTEESARYCVALFSQPGHNSLTIREDKHKYLWNVLSRSLHKLDLVNGLYAISEQKQFEGIFYNELILLRQL